MRRLLWLALLLQTSCATLVNGTHDDVVIDSDPPEATFELIDDTNRMIATGLTPATVKVSRSRGFYRPGQYELRLAKSGYLPKTDHLSSRVSNWYWVDCLIPVASLIIDPLTGGMWNIYDPPRHVLAKEIPFAKPATP